MDSDPEFLGESLEGVGGAQGTIIIDPLYWPSGSTVLGGGLRSLIASSYHCHCYLLITLLLLTYCWSNWKTIRLIGPVLYCCPVSFTQLDKF